LPAPAPRQAPRGATATPFAVRAIILAAGVGRRLAGFHAGPKCLLRFGGRTLLERHLACLRELGIAEVVVCTGHEAVQIERELERLGVRDQVITVGNPDFEQGSILSLWSVRTWLEDPQGVLLMDADVLYGRALLQRLVESAHANCFLLDRDFEAGEEPVKLCVAGGTLVEFRKHLAPELHYDYCGESVGFFRFDAAMGRRLGARSEHYRAHGRGDQAHEEALRDLLLAAPEAFGFEDVTGLAWIEIDFEQDVQRAEHDILPRIDA